MDPSAVSAASGFLSRTRVSAAVGAFVAAELVASSAGATSPTSRACPSASVVNAALGEKGKTPVATKTAYSKTCTYPGSGIVPTKITFQEDTLAQFAIDEKAVASAGYAKIVNLHGLGQAAWTLNVGDLYVFEAGVQIKILAPGATTAKLEVLARKLL